jgi:transcriptional regulator with XRE-family HTH domain
VRRIRQERGWTQERLAERLGKVGMSVAQSNVARLERGDRSVSVEDLYALALALSCPPLALLRPDDQSRVKVSPDHAEGEHRDRLTSWIVGRSPLDVPTDLAAFRAHGRPDLDRGGMTVGPFLHEIADRIDAENPAGQEEAVRAAIDYLKGSLRGIRLLSGKTMANLDVSDWTPSTNARRKGEHDRAGAEHVSTDDDLTERQRRKRERLIGNAADLEMVSPPDDPDAPVPVIETEPMEG